MVRGTARSDEDGLEEVWISATKIVSLKVKDNRDHLGWLDTYSSLLLSTILNPSSSENTTELSIKSEESSLVTK